MEIATKVSFCYKAGIRGSQCTSRVQGPLCTRGNNRFQEVAQSSASASARVVNEDISQELFLEIAKKA